MLPELTSKNHFQFGYTPSNKWWVTYGKCSREAKSFREECIETARTIKANTTENIFVLFSGGIDSEVTLRSFVEAGIPVTAAVMKFKNNLNVHDISFCFETCNALKVPVKFFDVDLLEFWKEDYLPYAHASHCFSPQLITAMHLMDRVPGYVVLGGGECSLVQENGKWYLSEKERVAGWYRYLNSKNRSGCPGFFQYTPEIMLSYLQDPMVKELVTSEKLSSADIKLSMYQRHFPIKARPKYTGYEKVQNEDRALRDKLKPLYGEYDQVVKTEYHELVKLLSNR